MKLLEQNIQYLQGVGPRRSELLKKELDIITFSDLLYYFPYKYIDRSKTYSIADIHAELPYIQIRGKIVGFSSVGPRHKQRLTALFTDGTGGIELVWFKGAKWIRESLKLGIEYIVFGKPTEFNRKINLIHPEVEEASKQEGQINASLQAHYNTSEKMKDSFVNSRAIQKLMQSLIREVEGKMPETLSGYITEQYKLMNLNDALLNIHFPVNAATLEKARYRLKFEELFYIQLNLLKLQTVRKKNICGFLFPSIGHYFNTFYQKHLPFQLTAAQKRVLKEIRRDLGLGIQMNRLLQGDVGSGKTLVALMTMLMALDNGYQTCLMAPTEILATQHYNTFSHLFEGMNITIQLLTGSTKKKDRTGLYDSLGNGSLQILIGTHALIEDTVRFKNLGLVVIDEQHRFGVAQRARLREKNDNPPHVLIMTATPIPRTLAMTLYGDLDVSVIDELPPGRKPVKTIHFFDSGRLKVFGFIRKQIAEGRQVFIVYPLISESEKLDYKYLEDGIEGISRSFAPPEYAISVVHGKMKTQEKEKSMKLFIRGQTQIMIATTVIEVGVDIPNASVMVIESAERFGLSQLHQLRGRVGRGADQSYCILMTSGKLSHEAVRRIETMVRTNDGFEIAEVDLQLRGPGDIEGTKQSGIPFDLKIANLGTDGQLLQYVRTIAAKILEDDPSLEKPENVILTSQLEKMKKTEINWGEIS